MTRPHTVRPCPTLLLLCGLLLPALLCMATDARGANQVVSDISEKDVAIEWDFRGTEILLFGAIDPATEPGQRNDVIIIVEGPNKDILARKKDRIAGVWINNEHRKFLNIPSYYSVLSTRPLTDITSRKRLSALGLGLQHLENNLRTADKETSEGEDTAKFREAVIRLMKRNGLYREEQGGVNIIADRLFRAEVTLPTNVPVGRFTANIYLFRDGQLQSRQISSLTIQKQGIEHTLTTLAFDYPFLYGLMCVAIAIAAGLSASLISRGR